MRLGLHPENPRFFIGNVQGIDQRYIYHALQLLAPSMVSAPSAHLASVPLRVCTAPRPKAMPTEVARLSLWETPCIGMRDPLSSGSLDEEVAQ